MGGFAWVPGGRRLVRWMLCPTLRVCAVCFASALTCYGQMDRGLITGIVTDSSGGVVPGVTVRATNLATNVAILGESDAKGNYTLNLLPPGEYKVSAEKTGFKTSEQAGILVHVSDRITVDFQLSAGEVTQTVEVQGAPPLLEASSSSLGTVIDNRQLQDLPLYGGNPLMLEVLAAGVAFDGNPQNSRTFDTTAAQITVNGGQTYSTSFQLDGVPDTWGLAPAFTPPAEDIQEYKVGTSSYDPSQGHSESAFVDVALKSGTNAFHGMGWFYFQNAALNANVYFNNGKPKPDYLYHRFGGNIGGPILKDRMFFFVGVSRLRENTPEPAFYTVPTAAERQGDFSALLALGPQYQIYDPATTRSLGNGFYSRDPFPNNIIPQGRFNPVGVNVMNYYPMPNAPGTADGTNNFNFAGGMEPDRYYDVVTRVDSVINEKQRVFGHVAISKRLDGPYRQFAPGASGNNLIYATRGAALDYIYTVNPQTVIDARYGFTRFLSNHTLSTAGFDASQVGLPNLNSAAGFPLISPTGYSPLNSEGGGDYDHANIHFFYGSVSRTAGNHQFQAGADFRVYQDNALTRGYANGAYYFGGSLNGPLTTAAASPLGPGAAGLLLGVLNNSGGAFNNASWAAQTRYAGLFFQDSWKAARNLTLNLGLRWEYEGPISDRYNRMNRGFAFNQPNPVAAQAMANYAAAPIPQIQPSQFQVNGGLLFAGVNGQPSGLYDALAHEFSPRLGLVYSFNPRTVVRGGYGIFFGQVGITTQRPLQTGFSATTPIVPSLDNDVTFVATLSDPFPNGFISPTGSSQGLSTFLGQSLSFVNPHPSAPYVQRWSLGVQRQLAANLMVEANYVGGHGVHLLAPGWGPQSVTLTGQQIDSIPNQYLSRLRVRDQATISALSRSVPNPFYNLMPSASLNTATTSVGQLLRPYPEFTSITTVNNTGHSSYNSLQVQVEQRFSQGFALRGNWTWSQTMEALQFLNAMDPAPSYVISPNDRTHRIAINGTYELPFGRGKRFGANATGLVNGLVGGWQIVSVYQLQSGSPLGFGDFILNDGASIRDIKLPRGKRTLQRWFNTDAFNRNSAEQLASELIIEPLRLSGVRGPGQNTMDFSLVKKTAIGERLHFDFRAECFNLMNHQWFSNPNTTPTSSAFGTITATNGNLPRTVQLGFVGNF